MAGAETISTLPAGVRRWTRIALVSVAAAAAAWLLTRHAGHVLQALPILILFACPLMHIMHHRHHNPRNRGDDA